jgi:Predicted transcriptional regulator
MIIVEVTKMKFSYKKLWKLLIDKEMKKNDLIQLAGISKSSVTKLVHDENITTDVLLKICIALDCEISDILEIEKQKEKE